MRISLISESKNRRRTGRGGRDDVPEHGASDDDPRLDRQAPPAGVRPVVGHTDAVNETTETV